MKQKKVVVVVDSIYRKAKEVFDSADDIRMITGPEEEHLLADLVAKEKASAVVLGTSKYQGPLYERIRHGSVLARFGVGCDGLDFEKARNHHLYITNTPGVLDQTVAEYTVFLAAEVLRKIGHVNQLIKQETWKTFLGNDLQGKTWAIIGFGNIGKRVSKILSFGFAARVVTLQRNYIKDKQMLVTFGVDQVFTDFADVVAKADIVSIHLPANSQTRHYFNKSRLKQINPGAILINTARGSLVDEDALYDLLMNGHIAGAGLDVFDNEPYIPVSPAKDLRKLSTVVMSPHLASSTVECCNRMARSVLADLRLAFEEKYDQMHLVQQIDK
jgi:lactate dehydrogenase-like 2-hydroxyacid dehydrogenase